MARGDTKLIFPGLGGLYAAAADYTYPLLRVVVGLLLIPHGWPKLMAGASAVAAGALARRGIEPALPLAYLLIFLETAGGVMIAIGLFTRPIAALLVIQFLVIIFKAHMQNGWMASVSGVEFVLLWCICFFIIMLRGGGKYSVDHAIGKEV